MCSQVWHCRHGIVGLFIEKRRVSSYTKSWVSRVSRLNKVRVGIGIMVSIRIRVSLVLVKGWG